MEVKLFEVRDTGTLMPVLAVHLESRDEAERWLLERAGYSLDEARRGEPYIVWVPIEPGGTAFGQAQYDPYEWTKSRTLRLSHQHAVDHWAELVSGDVIDVEYIRGKRSEPKTPERLDQSR